MEAGGLLCMFENAAAPLLLGDGTRLEPGDAALLAAAPPQPGDGFAWLPGYGGSEVRGCKSQIPVVIAPGLRVRVLAGEFRGQRGLFGWPALCLDAYVDTFAVLPLPAGARWQLTGGELVDEGGQLRALQPSQVLLWATVAEIHDTPGLPAGLASC